MVVPEPLPESFCLERARHFLKKLPSRRLPTFNFKSLLPTVIFILKPFIDLVYLAFQIQITPDPSMNEFQIRSATAFARPV